MALLGALLHGGVYADVDVVAKPQMVELLNANLNCSGIVFVEVGRTSRLIGFSRASLTDMVRASTAASWWPARVGRDVLTLDNIVAKFNLPAWPAEPTPELTGPYHRLDQGGDDAVGQGVGAIAAVAGPAACRPSTWRRWAT